MSDNNPFFNTYEQNLRVLEELRRRVPSEVAQAQREVQQFHNNQMQGPMSRHRTLPPMIGFDGLSQRFGG